MPITGLRVHLNQYSMLFEICEQEFMVMEAALQEVTPADYSPAARLKAALAVIRKSLYFLSEHLAKHPLGSVEEAITYCKVLLPKFYVWYIYHQEWYAMITALPIGTAEQIRLFWLDELRLVNRFPSRYSLHHAIYKMGNSDLDEVLFVADATGDNGLLPDIPESDPAFPTTCGYLFAKFKAYEMLSMAIVEAMDKPPMVHAPVSARRTKVMRWTGDSINLAELAFGIHDTGQINEGTATLAEIFEWMEDVLHIKLGRPSRRFDAIGERKKISPTDFLDRMKREINARIDRKNLYDPEAEEEKRRRKEKRAQSAAKVKELRNRGNSGTGN
jgi:hypothetical protein